MFQKLAKTVFGSSNDRYVKSIGKVVNQINALEDKKRLIELQLEGIKVLKGEHEFKKACYTHVGIRMRLDDLLERIKSEKMKIIAALLKKTQILRRKKGKL